MYNRGLAPCQAGGKERTRPTPDPAGTPAACGAASRCAGKGCFGDAGYISTLLCMLRGWKAIPSRLSARRDGRLFRRASRQVAGVARYLFISIYRACSEPRRIAARQNAAANRARARVCTSAFVRISICVRLSGGRDALRDGPILG